MRVERLTRTHGDRLKCARGCHDCCIDGITVFEVEADLIRERHAELLDTSQPHPPGACAFLDGEGACRIYPSRPYVCRTQGLPLRWVEYGHEGDVEHRDICVLNEEGPLITDLKPANCWTIGPVELKLQALQRTRQPEQGATLARVALRALFDG